MNKHIEAMRDALVKYQGIKSAAKERLNQVQALYGDVALEREHERQVKQLAAAREDAEATITAAYDAGMEGVKAWGRLDGAKLSDDAKLLDADLVDPAGFEELKAKHHDNAVMLLALKKYGERQNAQAAQEAKANGAPWTGDPYNVKNITTADDKAANWREAKTKALTMLDMFDGTGAYAGEWGKSLGEYMGVEMLEHFGEGKEY